MDDRQKRAVIAVVSIFAGGIALIVLLIVLASGGDDTKSVKTASDRTTTTSSSTTTSTTLPPVTTTLAPPTVPPTPPPTVAPPPTVVVIPPTAAPTTPSTDATTTSTAPTTTTTLPSPSKQLAAEIETALNGGIPPDPGAPKRVKVTIPPNPDNPDKKVEVDWDLPADFPLDPADWTDEEFAAVRQEALTILATIRDANLPGDQEIRVRGFVPDPDDEDLTLRIVRIIYARATIDGIDFPTYENVFDVPPGGPGPGLRAATRAAHHHVVLHDHDHLTRPARRSGGWGLGPDEAGLGDRELRPPLA